jgi:DNA polymerase III subunit epsilon
MTMLGLKKLLFRGGAPSSLPEDLHASLEVWRASAAPALDDLHFHTRYVVVDIVSSGMNPDSDQLLGIAASSVWKGSIQPDDTFYVDFSTLDGEGSTVDRQLMAFLLFAAKAPLVTYHIPYVGGFLRRAYKERLGVDFQPQWVDLAWLLPSMFEDKGDSVMPLDHWIEVFGLDAGSGRRDAMANTLLLARIFQMMTVRAVGKQIDTATQLIDESRASSFLRRNH